MFVVPICISTTERWATLSLSSRRKRCGVGDFWSEGVKKGGECVVITRAKRVTRTYIFVNLLISRSQGLPCRLTNNHVGDVCPTVVSRKNPAVCCINHLSDSKLFRARIFVEAERQFFLFSITLSAGRNFCEKLFSMPEGAKNWAPSSSRPFPIDEHRSCAR